MSSQQSEATNSQATNSQATNSMNDIAELEATRFIADLEGIATLVRTIAQQHREQSLDLLAVLRLLECLHQEIRDSFFQDSLPDNRQALYALLRDIETSGGWPYIHRMKLQALLANFPLEVSEEEPAQE